MAEEQEDLRYILEIDPDLKRVDAALESIAKKVDAVGKRAGVSMGDNLGAAMGRLGAGPGPLSAREIAGGAQTGPYGDLAQKIDRIDKNFRGDDLGDLIARKRAEHLAEAGQRGYTNQYLADKSFQHGGGREGSSLELAGSALGGMIGGPVGAEIGKQIAKAIPGTIAAPMKMVASGFEAISRSLQGLQGPLGPLGAALDLFGAGIGKVGDMVKKIPVVGEMLGPYLDAMAKVPGLVKDILGTLAQFAGMASPGKMHLLQMALEDVQATIGQAFVPMLEVMRKSIRYIGDTLSAVFNSPLVQGSIRGLEQALTHFGSAIADLIKDIGQPAVAAAITAVTIAIHHFTLGLRLLQAVLKPITLMLNLLGIGGVDVKAGASIGAAARPATMQGIEEYQRQLQISAFSQGSGDRKVTQEQVNKSVLSISEGVTTIADWTKSMSPSAIGQQVGMAVAGLLGGGDPHGSSAAANGAAAAVLGAGAGGGPLAADLGNRAGRAVGEKVPGFREGFRGGIAGAMGL